MRTEPESSSGAPAGSTAPAALRKGRGEEERENILQRSDVIVNTVGGF